MKTICLALAALALASPAIAKDVDIGTQPDWEKAKVNAIEMIKRDLKDEDSAKFKWRIDGWNQTKKGWVICGQVNSKNSYGAYNGYQQFKMVYVNHTMTSSRLAPEGLGFNECNTSKGYAAEPTP